MVRKFAFDNPDAALKTLADRLSIVEETESLGPMDACGRVLAEDVVADRDSPAADVSAMDGYAVRMADLQRSGSVAVSADSTPGNPPPPLTDDAVVRIFTGAIVPDGCEAVIKREDTEELDGAIRWSESAKNANPGENIRRAGENAPAGSTVLSRGTRLTAAQLATLANFGCYAANVFRPVSVAVITTGDEVGVFAKETPQPWQLRNSNRSSLCSLLHPLTWVQTKYVDHCRDQRESLTQLISDRIPECDAVLLTGGVSMGDYDYVPEVIEEIGGEIVFHGLPLRPGKPILGAATLSGKLILGLPGNPVSATVGCRRFAIPLLAKKSGDTGWNAPQAMVKLETPGDKTLPLYWLRLVRLSGHGTAQPVVSKGSGDLVSLGQSSGFVEVPPNRRDESAWPYYSWD